MKKERFEVIQKSKFERLSKKELQGAKGGLCISCMKRSRKIKLGSSVTQQKVTTKYGDIVLYPSGGVKSVF